MFGLRSGTGFRGYGLGLYNVHTKPKAQCGSQSHSAYLFAVQRVQPLHQARVQLDGVGDVGEHLLKGMGRLLVEQDAHGLAGLSTATDHGHQLGLDEVLGLTLQQQLLATTAAAAATQRRERA